MRKYAAAVNNAENRRLLADLSNKPKNIDVTRENLISKYQKPLPLLEDEDPTDDPV